MSGCNKIYNIKCTGYWAYAQRNCILENIHQEIYTHKVWVRVSVCIQLWIPPGFLFSLSINSAFVILYYNKYLGILFLNYIDFFRFLNNSPLSLSFQMKYIFWNENFPKASHLEMVDLNWRKYISCAHLREFMN